MTRELNKFVLIFFGEYKARKTQQRERIGGFHSIASDFSDSFGLRL